MFQMLEILLGILFIKSLYVPNAGKYWEFYLKNCYKFQKLANVGNLISKKKLYIPNAGKCRESYLKNHYMFQMLDIL